MPGLKSIVKSIKLTSTWEQDVRQLLHEDHKGPDLEIERREIREKLRLMRENYENGLYKGDEFQYWQKANGLKEKLDLLNRAPETAINKAAYTLLNLRESWEWATREERRLLVRTMIQEVGCDVGTKKIVWIKVNPDFEILFRLVNGLFPGTGRKYIIGTIEPEKNTCDMKDENGQIGAEVKSFAALSNNVLTTVEEYVQ